MTKPYELLPPTVLRQIQEEVLRNYRIRAGHLEKLAAGLYYRYGATINFAQGVVWSGEDIDGVKDQFQTSSGSYTQINTNAAVAVDLRRIHDALLPRRKSAALNAVYVGLLTLSKNARVRATFGSGDTLEASGGASQVFTFTLRALTEGGSWNFGEPLDVYYEVRGTAANLETTPAEVLYIQPFELRLSASNI